MAGKITHLEVLTQVAKHLEHGTQAQKNIATLLKGEQTQRYANLGTIAPDIFYYYHVLSPNKSPKAQIWGDLHHHHQVAELVLSFLDTIKKTEEGPNKDKMLAFAMGYICHCVVDVTTHPYIFFISGDYYNKDPKISFMAQYNHLKVEFALDTYLLDHRWALSPQEYDFNQYIDVTTGLSDKKMDPVIWYFWLQSLKKTFPTDFYSIYIGSEKKIIPGDIINDSYLGYLQLNSLLDSRSNWVRNTLSIIDKISFWRYKASVLMLPLKENIDPRVMNNSNKEWYYPADKTKIKNDSFISLINKAATNSKDVMTKAFEYVTNERKRDSLLQEYRGYNLDTGLRYQSIEEMTDFAPL
jgi:hypothetical protein